MTITEIYVDLDLDSDTGSGTIGDPYGRLQHAFDTVTQDTTNGDRFNCKGSFTLTAAFDLTTYGIPGSDSPLVIQGYTTSAGDGGIATFDCNGVEFFTSNSYDTITLIDLSIQGSSTGAVNIISLDNQITVIGCEVHDTEFGGIVTDAGSVIFNNYVYNTDGNAIELDSGYVGYNYIQNTNSRTVTHGIRDINTAGSVIHNNIVDIDGSSDGIEVDTGGCAIDNSIYSAGGTGIGIDAAGTNENAFIITGNVVSGFSGAGGDGIEWGNTTVVYGNNYLYNNTTHESGTSTVLLDLGNNETSSSDDPFLNAEDGYFHIAGHGNLRGGAYPNINFPNLNIRSYLDKGAGQRAYRKLVLAGIDESSGEGSSFSLTKLPGLSDGDLVVLVQTNDGGDPVTASPAGFTELSATTSHNACRLRVYYKHIADAASEPSSWDFTISGDRWTLTGLVFYGHKSTDPIPYSEHDDAAAASSIDAPSITGVAGGIVVRALSRDGTPETITLPSSSTNQWQNLSGDGGGAASSYGVTDDTIANPTGTASFSWTTSEEAAAFSFIVRPGDTGYIQKVLAIQPSDMILYLPLNEDSGTTAGNAEGTSARDGTYSGVAFGDVQGPDKSPVPTFDGATSHTDFETTSFTDVWDGDNYTVSVWARVTSASVWTDGTVRNLIRIEVDLDNEFYFRKQSANNQILMKGEAGAVSHTETIAISSVDWVHLAITVNAAADEQKYYVNGVLTETDTVLGTWAGTPGNVIIGRQTTVGSQFWDGYIAHVAIWSIPLSDNDIAILADAGGEVPNVLSATQLIHPKRSVLLRL